MSSEITEYIPASKKLEVMFGTMGISEISKVLPVDFVDKNIRYSQAVSKYYDYDEQGIIYVWGYYSFVNHVWLYRCRNVANIESAAELLIVLLYNGRLSKGKVNTELKNEPKS